jgi:hypothetical protein
MELYNNIQKILAQHDPESLISIGAPADEYKQEAKKLIVQLPAKFTVEDIAELLKTIFHAQFDSKNGQACEGRNKRLDDAAPEIYRVLTEDGRGDRVYVISDLIYSSPSPENFALAKSFLDSEVNQHNAFLIVNALLNTEDQKAYRILSDWFCHNPEFPNINRYIAQGLQKCPQEFSQTAKNWIEKNDEKFGPVMLIQDLIVFDPQPATLEWIWNWIQTHEQHESCGNVLYILLTDTQEKLVPFAHDMEEFATRWVHSNKNDRDAPSLMAQLLKTDQYVAIIELVVSWLKENVNHPRAGALFLQLLKMRQSGELLPLAENWLQSNPNAAVSPFIVGQLLENEPNQSNMKLAMDWINRIGDPDEISIILASMAKVDDTAITIAALKAWFADPIHSIRSDYMAKHNEATVWKSIMSREEINVELLQMAKQWLVQYPEDESSSIIREKLNL